MGRLFSPDSWVGKIFSCVGDMMLLNILFLLCCIPVLTIGASLVGLYSVAMKITSNRDCGIVKPFFKAWKGSLLKGLAFELIFGAVFVLVGLGLEVIRANPASFSWVFNAVYLLIFFLAGMLSCWTWPLEACFENSIAKTLKNAFLLGIANLGKSVIMVLLSLVPVLLLILSPRIFLATGVLWFLFGFAGIAMLDSLLLNKALKPYLGGETVQEKEQAEEITEQPEEIPVETGAAEEEQKQTAEITNEMR